MRRPGDTVCQVLQPGLPVDGKQRQHAACLTRDGVGRAASVSRGRVCVGELGVGGRLARCALRPLGAQMG